MNETSTGSSRKLKIITTVVVILLIASVVGNIRLFAQMRSLKDPTAAAQDQVRQIVAEVGKVIILPQDETPTVATVSDLEALKEQPFFTNAALGDQVLIYTGARKVLLWRPAEKKLIEVAPLNINIPSSSTALPPVGGTSTSR